MEAGHVDGKYICKTCGKPLRYRPSAGDTHVLIRIVRITGVNGMEISLDQMSNAKV